MPKGYINVTIAQLVQLNENYEMSIYLIAPSAKGPVKVGVSDNPQKRLKSLQTGHSDELFLWAVGECYSTLLGGYFSEELKQKIIKEGTQLGCEWEPYSPDFWDEGDSIDDYSAEKMIHKLLSPTNKRGEWFADDVFSIMCLLEEGWQSDDSHENEYFNIRWEACTFIRDLTEKEMGWSINKSEGKL